MQTNYSIDAPQTTHVSIQPEQALANSVNAAAKEEIKSDKKEAKKAATNARAMAATKAAVENAKKKEAEKTATAVAKEKIKIDGR